MRFGELREKLKSNKYPAFLLFGNDSWLKHRAEEYIIEGYNITDDGFAIDRLESPELDNIVLSCATPSFTSDVKLVVVTDFSFAQSKRGEEDKQKLSQLIAKCDGSYCIVIYAEEDKGFAGIDGLEKVDCKHLSSEQVTEWIVKYSMRCGVPADRLSASRLALYCLYDMARVANETQKLVDYGTFSVEAVDMLVHKDTEYVIYNLGNIIADKNVGKAMETYKGLVTRGEEVRSLFAVMYNFYRRAYYVKISAFDNKLTADMLNVKEGAISFAKEVSARYKPVQLMRALEYFAEADNKLKNFVNEDDVMYLLIMQLINL